MKKLTEKQQQTIEYWRSYYNEYGYYPTIREACAEFGLISINAVSDRLRGCARKGYMGTRDRDGRWMLTDDGWSL